MDRRMKVRSERERHFLGKRKMGYDSGGFRSAQDLRSSLTAKKNQKINPTERAPRITRKRDLVDARQKLQRKLKTDPVSKPVLKTQERQKDLKLKAQSRKRSLEFSSGSLKVTTREEIRSATVSGGSIQIVAKVGGQASINTEERDFSPPEKSRRARGPMDGNLTITAKNPNWRDGSTPENWDIPDLLQETEDDLAVYELEGRLRSRGSYRPKAVSQTPQPSPVTKITVTNLHPLVSQQDIEELFGVLGSLKDCKLIRPGTAEVIYANKEDATTAHLRYHNRKLDGQPMLCKLESASSVTDSNQVRSRPLPPLHHAAPPSIANTSTPRASSNKEHSIVQASRPVVFKVRI